MFQWHCIFVFLIAIIQKCFATTCPSNGCTFQSLGCTITPDQQTMHCQQRNIVGTIHITDLPTTLQTIHLNLNQITSIASTQFHTIRRLKHLYLGNNAIASLSLKQFKYNRDLTILSLANNKIRTLQQDHFLHNIELIHLDLSTNLLGIDVHLTDLDQKPALHKNQFDTNTKLQHLSLHNNQINKIASIQFHQLIELTTLNIQNNALTSLDSNQFDYNPKLHNLDVTQNPLDFVLHGCILPNIRTLNCSGTYQHSKNVSILSMSQVPISIHTIDLSNNHAIESVAEDVFHKFIHLTSLNMSNNSLSTLPSGIFLNQNVLTNVDVSNNPLDFITKGCNFVTSSSVNCSHLNIEGTLMLKDLPMIKSLDLSYNHITSLELETLKRQGNSLESLNLYHNKIIDMPATIFDDNVNLMNVNLDHNPVSNVHFQCGPLYDYKTKIEMRGTGMFYTCNKYTQTLSK